MGMEGDLREFETEDWRVLYTRVVGTRVGRMEDESMENLAKEVILEFAKVAVVNNQVPY